MPSVVSVNSEGYYSVDYAKLTPVLVEAVKEQQTEIDLLKIEIAELKAMLTEMAKQNNSTGKNIYGNK